MPIAMGGPRHNNEKVRETSTLFLFLVGDIARVLIKCKPDWSKQR
jgi:hypothetical protein